MAHYDYLIVGGGMAAASAVNGIREVDPLGSIGIISAEQHPPYNRPPLTKMLWKGVPEKIIWRRLPQANIDLTLGRRVITLDPHEKRVTDETGQSYDYRKLLLATGGSPRRLPFGGDEILYYRTLDDYRQVRAWTGQGKRFGVIGGGFIGSEIASVLASTGEQVSVFFPENGIGTRVFPADLAEFVTDYYRQKGVDLHPGTEIQATERRGEKLALRLKNGAEVEVDHLIAGIGLRPNTELAQSAGIELAAPETGGGILVDETLQTSQADIYAAGDVASFFNPALSRRMRVEHDDNAESMGRAAGLNMAGRTTPYTHQPYFYSDLFDLGYEAVGELDPRLDIVENWTEPFHKGVVYYMRDNKVRGVLLWNVWGQVGAARKLIAGGQTFSRQAIIQALPEAQTVSAA